MQAYKLKAKRHNEKHSPWFYGPYKFVERIWIVAFTHCRIHQVFHFSLLKRAVQPDTVIQDLPPLEMANKPVLVDIVRTRPHFDGESPH